jgi:hypothetical protein
MQQFGLQQRAHFPNFIQEQRATIGEFEFPRLVSDGSRKCPSFIAEEFRFVGSYAASPGFG